MPRTFRSAPGRENARRQVEYANVTATLASKSEKAVLLSSEHIAPAQWVPLYKLDASSKVKAMRAVKGDELTLQVELQFALDEGLV